MAVPTQRPGSSLTYLYPIITCPKMFHFPIPYSWSQNGTFLPTSPLTGDLGVYSQWPKNIPVWNISAHLEQIAVLIINYLHAK